MTLRSRVLQALEREDVNFLLTNRIPRRLLTKFAGWFSRIEQPLVRDISIDVWRFFSDLDLSEASTTQFRSLHDCFTRHLKPGVRPINPDPQILVSPCDAIVGAFGKIAGTDLFQIKGAHYELADLLCDSNLVDAHRDGRYVTLRLTSSMYHRFHAPHDCHVDHVTYIPGDTWNVNPAALRRVEKLYCKNERAILRTKLSKGGYAITLVPVGAVACRRDSSALHRRRALPAAPRTQRRGLQCRVQERRRDGMVRARLHHYRLCAGRFLILR